MYICVFIFIVFMISLIICSKHQDIDDKLKTNIQNTIGIEYELLVIDNSNNQYSIFEAYNEGVKKAKYDFYCFMHEDIWYHTQDWGNKVIKHLSVKETGLIGSAGSFYLSRIPSPWFKAKPYVKSFVQSYNNEPDRPPKYYTLDKDYQVLCLDGFWMCSKKEVFEKVSFDSDLFKGFHCYDLDICLQVYQAGYKTYVVSDILIQHFSTGSMNRQWIDETFKLYKKWKSIMPVSVYPNLKKRILNETKAFRDILYTMYLNDYKENRMPVLKKAWSVIHFNILTAYILLWFKLLTKGGRKKSTPPKLTE